MPAISPVTIDVLRHLQVHGARTRKEIVKALGAIPSSMISNLHFLRHITTDETTKELRYVITPKGLLRLKYPNGRAPADKVKVQKSKDHHYKPVELRDALRPGSMQAFSLPSRIGDWRHWPDGRVTHVDAPRQDGGAA